MSRNLAPWRRETEARYGSVCAARDSLFSDCDGPLECHHIIYRSQGGVEDPENGLMLCRQHHDQVHARQLLIHRDWLWSEQVAYLKAKRWVWWDHQFDEGMPYGRGYKGFAPLSSRV